MATKKTKTSNSRTVYIYSGSPDIDNSMLTDELSNDWCEKLEDAKEEAKECLEEDGCVYLYKVQLTKVLIGSKPEATWEKV